jgi:aspartate racemase
MTSGRAAAAPLHIGIAAVSAEGAALCYRTICAEAAGVLGAHAHPEITLHAAPLADYVRCLERADLAGVAELLLRSARLLAAAGADFLVCPDNTVHLAFHLVTPGSPRPWLSIADVVADEAAARGFHRPGVLGTRWLVDGEVYPDALRARGLECVRPAEHDRAEVSRIILEELVYGRFEPESVAKLQAAVRRLQAEGCDAVILGCTELPLVLDETNCPLPPLDSTRLLARAALRRSAGL